jgi:hypothetical protein
LGPFPVDNKTTNAFNSQAMKVPNPDKLFERAKKERKEKIERANREYAEEVKHIKWLRQQFSGSPSPSGNNEVAEAKNNGNDSFRASIRAAINSLKQFTADDVVAWLVRERPEANAKDKRDAVVSILSRMGGKGTLETVERGTRGKPQVYKIGGGTSAEGEPIPKSTTAHL